MSSQLVFFAPGKRAEGRAFDTENYIEADEILEVKFWRWGPEPELVFSVSQDEEARHVEEWFEPAFNGQGELREDTLELAVALERHKVKGDYRSFWDVVRAGWSVDVRDIYRLRYTEAARVGVEFAGGPWHRDFLADAIQDESLLYGQVVFFALGEEAGGKALDTDEDFETDELVELSFWRWGPSPELIVTFSSDGESETREEWASGAYADDGTRREDAELLYESLQYLKEDGPHYDLWYMVGGGEAAAIDGYILGSDVAAKVGVTLA